MTQLFNGMAQGINSGISLFNAVEGKRHRDREFQFREDRARTQDLQWEQSHALRQSAEDRHNHQFNVQEALRQREELMRTAIGSDGQLLAEDQLEGWLAQNSESITGLLNAGVGVPGAHVRHNQDSGTQFSGVTVRDGHVYLTVDTPNGPRPLTRDRSSDPDDPVVGIPVAQFMNMMSEGGYANKQRALAVAATAIQEEAQANGQRISALEAQRVVLRQALEAGEIEPDELSAEQEQLLTDESPEPAAQTEDAPGPAAQTEEAPSLSSAAQDSAAGLRRTIADIERRVESAPAGAQAEGLRRTLDALQTNLNRLEGTEEATDPTRLQRQTDEPLARHRQNLEAAGRRQAFDNSQLFRTPSEQEFEYNERSYQQRAQTEGEGAQPAGAAASNPMQSYARSSLDPQQRQVIERQIQQIDTELAPARERYSSLRDVDARQLANRFGINLSDADAAQQLSQAIRFGDPSMTASQYATMTRQAQSEQRAEARAMRQEIRDEQQAHNSAVDRIMRSVPASGQLRDGVSREDFAPVAEAVVEMYGHQALQGNTSVVSHAINRAARAGDPQLMFTYMAGVHRGVDGDILAAVVQEASRLHDLSPADIDHLAQTHREAINGMRDMSERQRNRAIKSMLGEATRER